jgi:hypothetical protein
MKSTMLMQSLYVSNRCGSQFPMSVTVRVLCEYDNVDGMQVADSVRRHSSDKIR